MPSAQLIPHVGYVGRRTAGDARPGEVGRDYDRQPSTDLPYITEPEVSAPYFPEGGVAAPPYMIVSPLSKDMGSYDEPVGHGQPNQLVGPATVEWIKPRASHEQGAGVPPFKKWARQFHTEAYNFTSLAFAPFPDQIGPMYLQNINKPERFGWSVPKYYEQYQQGAADPGVGTGVISTNDPASVAFAIGWGFVG